MPPGKGSMPLATVGPTGAAGRGQVALRTQSGNSLGSLEQYCMDWNATDSSEVSAPGKALHPASPSVVGLKFAELRAAFHKAGAALASAEQTTDVSIFRLNLLLCYRYSFTPSPRDSG